MVRVVIRSALLKVAQQVENRTPAMEAAGMEGATIVAELARSELIPAIYNGKQRVIESLDPRPFPSSGKTLARVRLYEVGKYWRWYEFGTKPHSIDPVHLAARGRQAWLKFYWSRVGATTYLLHVDHPGFAGVDRLAALMQGLRELAIEQWTPLITQAIAEGFQGGSLE